MKEGISRKKFIRLGAAIGVSATGASIVAACGGGGDGGSSNTGSAGGGAATNSGSEGSTGSASSGGQAIAQATEVPKNSAMKFTDSGQPAVLIHLESGDFVAYSAICTHQQCTVAYEQQSSQLACPCHGSLFDPSQGGEVVSGPAQQPLPKIQIQVQDGEITKA